MLTPDPSTNLGLPGVLQVLLFGVLVPIGAWRSAVRLREDPLPPKRQYFAAVIVQQLLLLGFSLWVAQAIRLELFPPHLPAAWQLGGAAVVVIGLARIFWSRWKEKAESRDRITELVAPIDRADHVLWVVISCLAGVGEEIGYRGVLFAVLATITGEPVSAAVLASAAFAGGHLAQGRSAALASGLVALGMHALVAWTGTLYLAMMVHAGYDLVAGFSYGYLRRRSAGESIGITDSARTPS